MSAIHRVLLMRQQLGTIEKAVMVDEVDKADLYMQQMIDAAISNRASPEIVGVYGECDDCGEEGRLVEGICVPCRKLIEDRNKRWR